MNAFTFSPADHARIVQAIQTAESHTSGEIRVVISRKRTEDAMRDAQRQFERLGMTRTDARNGVLIFVAPRSRAFAVIGDAGVHEKCGDAFWQELATAMRTAFRQGAFVTGIILGIERAGALLGQHFPAQPGNRNELPDDVEED